MNFIVFAIDDFINKSSYNSECILCLHVFIIQLNKNMIQ